MTTPQPLFHTRRVRLCPPRTPSATTKSFSDTSPVGRCFKLPAHGSRTRISSFARNVKKRACRFPVAVWIAQRMSWHDGAILKPVRWSLPRPPVTFAPSAWKWCLLRSTTIPATPKSVPPPPPWMTSLPAARWRKCLLSSISNDPDFSPKSPCIPCECYGWMSRRGRCRWAPFSLARRTQHCFRLHKRGASCVDSFTPRCWGLSPSQGGPNRPAPGEARARASRKTRRRSPPGKNGSLS